MTFCFIYRILIFLVAEVVILTQLNAQSYTWKQVVIKGGGYVPGLIYSKADPTLLYARTDVGGAYRWNATNKTWIPITDGMTDANDWGVWSIAPDPLISDRVYIATGLYSEPWGAQGVIYRSENRGISWTKMSTLNFKLGGNNPGRGICERLVVDPNENSILLLGSKKDGLYKSIDCGASWTKVTGLNASYITFVEFDKSTGSTGNATQTIYTGVADYIYNNGNVGIYKSTDGGTSWNKITGQPTALTPKNKGLEPGDIALTPIPTKMAFTQGNVLYFTFSNSVTPDGDGNAIANYTAISNGAVYKYNKLTNVWTDITPSNSSGMQGGCSSIAVHPTDANKIAITTIARWWPYDEIYFSADAGANWSSTLNSFGYNNTWGNSLNKATISTVKAPWATANIGWPNSIIFNPYNGNEVMFGSGGGVYACYDVSGLFTNPGENNSASTTWVYENDGLEEACVMEMVSPPFGAPLISVIGDVDGFVHTDLDVSSQNRLLVGSKWVGSNRSIDFAENAPSKMVKTHDNNEANKGAYSLDGGASWAAFLSRPSGISNNDECGKIAISANGNNIVWAPKNGAIAFSTNNGATWTESNGGIAYGLKPVSDRVNSSKFYVFDPSAQKFYYSVDGGVNFSSTTLGLTGIPNYESVQPQICAVFGKEGHVLMANKMNGLYRTKDGGLNFTKITTVTEAYRVTVGKASPTGTYPAIFIYGIVNNNPGLFRSDDEGLTWERINNAEHEYARNHEFLCGDPRIYGRIYDAIGGRGIVYGDINATVCKSVNLGADTAVCPGESIELNCGISLVGYSYTWTKDGSVLTETSDKLTVSDKGFYRVTASKTGCPSSSSSITVGSCTCIQTINLKPGWNLISINVIPKDNTIASIFKDVDVLEIKTMDTFWSNLQPDFLNKMKTITPGNGYLVNMYSPGTLTITGIPISNPISCASTRNGWQLIGCSYQSAKPMVDVFGNNFLIIKDFNGFRTPVATQNSLDFIEPGRAYFLKR